MKETLRRILLLLILCCYVFFATAAHAQQPVEAAPSFHDEDVQTTSAGEASPIPTIGDDNVQKAVTILHKIKPPTSRLARFNNPKGVFRTSVYYAKELFYLLFMNSPQLPELITSKSRSSKPNTALFNAVELLNNAGEQDNRDALYLLAEMNFYGNFTHPRNYSQAFQYYRRLADLDGNATAQNMLGFMYATGIGGAVKQDQAKAMLYHTFAADGEDTKSQMTMAYRHHAGISTARNCDKAVRYYHKVAEKAVSYYRSGPPGGHSLIKEAYRLADEEGGVYGEGASIVSAGANAKQGGPTSDAYAALDDVLEFLDMKSREGDLKATLHLGRMHYEGAHRELSRDLRAAKEHFMRVARQYWTAEGKTKTDVHPGTEKLAGKAAGYLGRMFLRGEGIQQSFPLAKVWFNRGISQGDALSQYMLGVMYLEGFGVEKDVVYAAELFGAAADQDLAAAQTRLGALFLDQGDLQTATAYFEHATRSGHIEAFYYLADINNQGLGRDRSCGMAAVYYKVVAEKAEVIHSAFPEANEAYENGDRETALVAYMMAAEQGYENAQANVAYLLDQAQPRFSLSSLLPFLRHKATAVGDAALALIYWTRSAKQSNFDSLVKMGDYYLDGLGTIMDREKAAACYQAAAETMQSAQAMWNLGWMHENGIGIEQDFHLAKRYYDQALDTNREAYLPVQSALFKLRFRSWWNKVTHGNVNSIKEDDEPKKSRTFGEWLTNFLEADAAYYADHDYEPDDWDTHSSDPMPGGDGEYFDDDIDDDIIETLIIVGLAATLAFLVYYRHRQREQQRQAVHGEDPEPPDAVGAQLQAQIQEQQPDGGFFPQPGNLGFNDWVAGGIGH
ncbi:ERAD-associated protein [Elasticomyces elasticus]|nr:ERAD-associated protein [Elasticomyces elasticus]